MKITAKKIESLVEGFGVSTWQDLHRKHRPQTIESLVEGFGVSTGFIGNADKEGYGGDRKLSGKLQEPAKCHRFIDVILGFACRKTR